MCFNAPQIDGAKLPATSRTGNTLVINMLSFGQLLRIDHPNNLPSFTPDPDQK